MDTQNTPIHVKLWHRDFWLLTLAALSLSVGAYMQIPSLAAYASHAGLEAWQTGLMMGVMGLGLFLFGPVCGYWVQRYRRCRVCTYALLGAMVSVVFLCQAESSAPRELVFPLACAGRFLFGACYGLAAMVLFSTLVIDMCESFQRTEANYLVAWAARFALAIGPLVSVSLLGRLSPSSAYAASVLPLSLAFLLLCVIRFPFKAPYDQQSPFGLDRFLLSRSFPLCLSLALMAAVVGLSLSMPRGMPFYALMGGGLALAMLAEKFAFANANLKSEVLTGLIMIAFTLLLEILVPETDDVRFVTKAVLLGMGIGLIGSRFQLFFVKMAKHCQRGSSQSSYFLSWELGVCLGLFIGMSVRPAEGVVSTTDPRAWIALALVVINLLVYNFYIHGWYMRHRNR